MVNERKRKKKRRGENTNLVLPATPLPPLVLLPLPHILDEQTAPALLGVLAPFDDRVRAWVSGGKAE
jgi:hypothetical protein